MIYNLILALFNFFLFYLKIKNIKKSQNLQKINKKLVKNISFENLFQTKTPLKIDLKKE